MWNQKRFPNGSWHVLEGCSLAEEFYHSEYVRAHNKYLSLQSHGCSHFFSYTWPFSLSLTKSFYSPLYRYIAGLWQLLGLGECMQEKCSTQHVNPPTYKLPEYSEDMLRYSKHLEAADGHIHTLV